MQDIDMLRGLDLESPYEPVAIYLEDSDSVEYLRKDVPTVYHRVDAFLTLACDMMEQKVIGFRLKGFKNFFIRVVQPEYKMDNDDFLELVTVLERAVSNMGEDVFDEKKKKAYQDAQDIAREDGVKLTDLPSAA